MPVTGLRVVRPERGHDDDPRPDGGPGGDVGEVDVKFPEV